MNQHPLSGYTHVMYALHALAGFIGVTSGASIIGAFVFGIPSIIAMLMNYARRDAVRGTWLESPFPWQAQHVLDRGGARHRAVLHRAAADRRSASISLGSMPLTGAGRRGRRGRRVWRRARWR